MTEPTVLATLLVAFITGGVTLWTQRGGARARRQTEYIAARNQDLVEFQTLRDTALDEARELRDEQRDLRTEMEDLRKEIHALRAESSECSLLLSIAGSYIRIIRPMIPDTVKAPPLPDVLKSKGIGV